MGSSTPNWVMLLARSSSPDLENFRRGFILLGWIFLRSTSGTPSSFCGRRPPRHGEPDAPTRGGAICHQDCKPRPRAAVPACHPAALYLVCVLRITHYILWL